jgi:hypothetical protein
LHPQEQRKQDVNTRTAQTKRSLLFSPFSEIECSNFKDASFCSSLLVLLSSRIYLPPPTPTPPPISSFFFFLFLQKLEVNF